MIDPDRAVGCVVGSAVGDALGAPFEFGPEGAFSARFPRPGQGGEMCGGGGWEPGEATDDTQMAVLVGESLLEHGGLEPATRRRGRARPSPRAGADRPDRRRPAGSAPGRPRRGTSGPPRALRDRPRPRLDPDLATEFNGAVWPCLGSAVWALRTTSSYEEAVRAAVDLGGDTDTVAAVTGGLAGAVYGIEDIPERWTIAVHVPLPGWGDRVLRLPDLTDLARRLASAA